MVCTISLIWCMVFLIGNNFLWTNWSVNSFTAQSVCFFIVCLCWCYCCYRHRHLCSIRLNIHICNELVILKSYWFAYHANNAFNVHDGANATTNWIGLPCETRNNERCLTFFQLDLNGMAKINRDNGSDRWRYHQKYNYKTNTKTNESISLAHGFAIFIFATLSIWMRIFLWTCHDFQMSLFKFVVVDEVVIFVPQG